MSTICTIKPTVNRIRILLCLALATPAWCASPFTIEQALSAPFPGDLVASPKGDAVAWVLDTAGVRNIWVARAPEFRGAAITQFAADDGQEIGDIAWMPDASAVFFTQGGGPNGRGEIPNPQSDPAGVHQEIWSAPVAGGARKIGDGHAPVVSPDGATVAWLAGNQIWSAPANGSAAPAQLIHARGIARNLAWAPDGSRLAFASDRGDHAFIGVYDVRGKSLRFIDASVDTDQSPAWSRDGRQIAFIRIPTARDAGAYGAKRRGQPWSIRIADAASGKGHEIWRAQEGAGSVFWRMIAANQLLWAEGDRIVFPWERDGWLHLYSIPAGGGAAAALTPGNFEVEDVTLTPDRKTVVFSSNQDDLDRRHVWRVSPGGGQAARLTPGSGIEWSPAALANDRVALLHSDAKMPARAAVLETSAIRDFVPSTFAPAFVEPQPVIYQAADGMAIHGQLFLPPGGGKHPAVVFFHGGSRRQMLLGWHPMQYYNQAYAFNQYLASKGYVVLAINYRSGTGYGSDFREALRFGPTGASEFNDVLGAGLYLRTRADVDAARIGAWGGSYGGYLTALGLARASDLFAVGVDLHGIHDWNLEFPNSGWTPEVQRLAFESSPLAAIETWRSPVLLIQGDDDRNVAFSQTVQVVEALRKHGVPFEQLIFPDEVHEFLLHSHWVQAYHAADEYLARYLKP
jgi:dipeptidyl aminopeptidase/acylaminoacyl peptidase